MSNKRYPFSRRQFISSMFGAATAVALPRGARAQDKPNVLMIAIDDLNDWVGCLGGHPNAKTPNIDALAARGTLFTNAHCQAPICGPSRASLFTGLQPATTGIYGQISDTNIASSSDIAGQATFMPDYFEAQGYRTLAAGKLFHNGDRADVFQSYGPQSHFGPKPEKRFNYDPDWFDDRIGSTQTDWGAYPEEDADMPDTQFADWAVEELGKTADDPFFMAVGFVRPHVPWYVPERWFKEHPLEGIKTPPYQPGDQDDVPPISREVNAAPMMPGMEWVLEKEGRWEEIVQAYSACVTFVDHQVGRVLAALEASPHADNTIVVLWSDHGYHLGEKDRFAKQALWERASKVVLMMAGPGLPAGQRCTRPVQLLDLYPTLLAQCGLPANPMNEGHDLTPLLQDAALIWPHPAITTYGPDNHAAQTERFRYIRYENGAEELYDHSKDPNEWNNVAGAPEYAQVIARLQATLPATSAPNAKGSTYDFNEYFKRVLK